MQIHTLILLSLTVIFAACGKPAEKDVSLKKERISPEQMSLIIDSQNITCGDQEFCPEGVARMFAINFEDVNTSSTCSAFLIAPDLVMTNSHCVYGKKLSLAKICSGLYFVFPHNGFSYSAQCSQIIWRDNRQQGRRHYRDGDNDFALIRLDQNIPLQPLKLRRGGLRAGAKVYPVVVDQVGGYTAKITKLECLVEKVMPKYGVVQLSGCPVISGNSGAPVMDEDFNVVGVIFASSDNTIRKPSDEQSLRVRSHTKGFAFSMDHIHKVIGHLL
ncbi:MAG: trypsin-like peptidase domain-containing protein [Bdellovibrionales bacterium]|nr:trypsin-like peptidase domain-containing protein [Bdellovibrionales bacterium]